MKYALIALVLLGTSIINSYRFATTAGAAAFRSISYKAYGSVTGPSAISTISVPSGVVNGDILILAFVAGQSTVPVVTMPGGWTTIQGPSTTTAGGFNVVRVLAWKVASSEPASYDITTDITANTSAVMVAVSGASGSTPVSSSNSGTGSTTTATGITTPSNNSVVAFIAHNWVLYGTASPPSGTTPTFTERLDAADSLIYVATGVLATAGATGNKTQSNLNGASDGWGAFLVSCGP